MNGSRLLALIGCVVVVASCGEKEEPDPPSAAAAVTAGDEICAAAAEQVASLRSSAAPRTPEDAAELTADVLAIHESEIEDLRSLSVPEELRASLDRYLAARERGLEPLREGLQAARAGNPSAYARAQAEAASGQVRRTELARAVGFSDCSVPAASGSQPPG